MPAFFIDGMNNFYTGYHGFSSAPVQAMFVMLAGATCAIHSVGLIATDATVALPYDVVDALGKSNLIDSHSFLQGGNVNVRAGSSGSGGANLELYDSSFVNPLTDNADIFSPNAKVVRNSFAGAGAGYSGSPAMQSGTNVRFTGVDIVLSDNIIQQAAGWGVDIGTARSVRISSNFFDNNGKLITGMVGGASYATGALRIGGSGHVTVCGNTFSESAGASVGSTANYYSAHVTFAGNVDTVSFCGNVYLPLHGSNSNSGMQTTPGAVMIHPDYDFEVDNTTSPVLTNIAIADNPAPQNLGVMSPNAALYLPNPPSSGVPNRYLAGLTMVYHSGSTLTVKAGAAVDGSNTVVINIPTPGCPIDFTLNGAGGLDMGGAAPKTTYFIYVISGPGGANPSCMASTSLTPSFVNTSNTYKIKTQGMTFMGSSTVYAVGQGYNGTSALSPVT